MRRREGPALLRTASRGDARSHEGLPRVAEEAQLTVPSKAKTVERGYGEPHRRLRRQWARIVNAGGAQCARCLRPILPGDPWDLDHEDARLGYLGPSHRTCNRAAGGASAPRPRFSRDW